MTIARALAKYLEEELGIGTFGTDLFIGAAPKSEDAPDQIYWLVANGGSPISTNQTGERRKQYIVNLYMRSLSAEDIDTTLQNIEETINIDRCTQLEGFDTIDIEATSFSSDEDIDNEDRTVGLLQITATTYL